MQRDAVVMQNQICAHRLPRCRQGFAAAVAAATPTRVTMQQSMLFFHFSSLFLV